MLQNDILPTLDSDQIEVAVIHCFHEGQSAATHVQAYGLTYSMALDFDRELFRRFRLPDHVFPLNLVIDKAGGLAYLGTDLDEAVAAAEALVE